MSTITSRLKHAWNAFFNQDWTKSPANVGPIYGGRPDQVRLHISNERSIISSILTRLSIDTASVDIRHVRLDDQNRYLEDVNSGLNYCLTEEANIDQGARHLRQNIAMSLFNNGVVAIVPVDTTLNPEISGAFDVKTLRVGEIVAWYPKHIRVRLYNEERGEFQEITLEKKFVGIVENPLYAVMNEPNSTLRRLIRKLNLLDAVDEQSSSGKLDLIIQLPYVIKSEARRQQAEQRRRDIEAQLKGSQYGIAYTDGTEKVVQLNRPAENNLLEQIKFLTEMLYAQLGLTPEVMNGTANEQAMLNYQNRTIEPIVAAIVEAMKRAFLTKTARAQRQSILPFWDPFKYVPVEKMADIADKFTRNEIASPNDMRQVIGWKPVRDPAADELRNRNMPKPEPETEPLEERPPLRVRASVDRRQLPAAPSESP
jgi:hypothetical protein